MLLPLRGMLVHVDRTISMLAQCCRPVARRVRGAKSAPQVSDCAILLHGPCSMTPAKFLASQGFQCLLPCFIALHPCSILGCVEAGLANNACPAFVSRRRATLRRWGGPLHGKRTKSVPVSPRSRNLEPQLQQIRHCALAARSRVLESRKQWFCLLNVESCVACAGLWVTAKTE